MRQKVILFGQEGQLGMFNLLLVLFFSSSSELFVSNSNSFNSLQFAFAQVYQFKKEQYLAFFYLIISARSRVRGTLEVYHAFIRDLDASDTSSSTNNEPDWELVNEGETEPDVEAVAHTQVFRCQYDCFLALILQLINIQFVYIFAKIPQNAYGTSSGIADPLPTGWEERQDANGNIQKWKHSAQYSIEKCFILILLLGHFQAEHIM